MDMTEITHHGSTKVNKDTDDSDDAKQPLLASKTFCTRSTLASVAIVSSMMAAYMIAVISLQVSGIESNIIQLNSLRYFIQSLLNIPLLCTTDYSLKVSKAHVHIIALSGILNMVFASGFYFAASFMPVGNLDGLMSAFYILATTAIDYFYKKTISKTTVVISCIAALGIILVIQPWNIHEDQAKKVLSPCHYIDSELSLSGHNNVSHLPAPSNDTYSDIGRNIQNNKSNQWLGYLFLVIGCVTIVVDGNILKFLVHEYPAPVVLFWVILLECILSFIMNLLWTGARHESRYSFPSVGFCLLFACTFIVSSGIANSLSYFALQYFNVSTLAFTNAIVTVSLYISQRTFLSYFHPGHANVTELLGIAIIIGGALLPALYFLLQRK